MHTKQLKFTYNLCRQITWINGPVQNSSIMSHNFDENVLNVQNMQSMYVIDISEDPVSGNIFVITNESLLLVRLGHNSMEHVIDLNYDELPLFLDVFEIFAYFVLESGKLVQIDYTRKNAGKFNLFDKVLTLSCIRVITSFTKKCF